jgi:hypothetical protein
MGTSARRRAFSIQVGRPNGEGHGDRFDRLNGSPSTALRLIGTGRRSRREHPTTTAAVEGRLRFDGFGRLTAGRLGAGPSASSG